MRWALLAPVVLLVLLVAAWAIDMRNARDEVVRNTTVAGVEVGGHTDETLRPVLAGIDEQVRGTTIEVRTPGGSFTITAGEVDLAVDADETVEAALDAGRKGPVAGRPFAWAASFASAREAPLRVDLDRPSLVAIVAERDPTGREPAVEPSIAAGDDGLRVVDGADGRGLSATTIADAVREAATDGEVPIVVDVEPQTLEPVFTNDDVQALIEDAEARTSGALEVEAGGIGAAVPPETQRAWLRSRPTATGLELEVDGARVVEDLAALLPEAGEPPTDARFRVSGGTVVIEPGRSGTGCCGEEAADLVLAAITADSPDDGPVELSLRTVEPDLTEAEARALGIVAPIGSFTTNHASGQSRVTNIHRIADLVRGVVMEPGETFSVNGHVGRRTTQNGFVTGGVIQNGVFEESVGGGISQFATTLFNAAFFAGLDITEYQSHSIYISRYPYGREATLSFPQPDLKITNNTPHGVLLWPTYTASSITVTIYSTPWVRGEQTGQRESRAGNCTRVTTERTRTYLEDGRTEVDNVYATYRPGEGVDC